MFSRLLIANRGEIACRIARTCRRLGLEYVAVYSEADADALHLQGAAKTVCLGPAPAASSYLDVQRVVRAAVETGCDAVHPGYGFLAENAAFARAVREAGLTFVGPAPQTIEAMGDKARAKALMRQAGVPVVPGSDEASEEARRIAALVAETGFPALLKPVAGGGGKGMVILEQGDDIAAAVQAAVRQARASFGDGRLLVERYVRRPRHIEVQVFGDSHGNVVHLFERECSLQRRHQKIVEEAPAVNLSAATRAALREAAVAGARAIAYANAGTFEFIVAEDGKSFFFLEMNTRLQVEHPVTEMVTGLDLVEWQLRVAAGESLPKEQSDLSCDGHAIECRIYAEDPTDDFKPSPGRLLHVAWPQSIRVDAGVSSGAEVPAFYDPIIAKLIVHDADRESALERMQEALAGTRLLGLKTNTGFLRSLLSCPEVVSGEVHTGFVDEYLGTMPSEDGGAALACAGAIGLARSVNEAAAQSPWTDARTSGALDRRYLDPQAPLGRLSIKDPAGWQDVHVRAWKDGCVDIEVAGGSYAITLNGPDGEGLWHGKVDDMHPWAALADADAIELQVGGNGTRLLVERASEDMDDDSGTVALTPMPGVVAAVMVAPGEHVEKGQVVAVVEAMKMENSITAPMAGIVSEVCCEVGDTVSAGTVLVSLEEA